MVEIVFCQWIVRGLGDDVITPHLPTGLCWACSRSNLCAHSLPQPTCHRATFQVTAQSDLESRTCEWSQSSTRSGQKRHHSLSCRALATGVTLPLPEASLIAPPTGLPVLSGQSSHRTGPCVTPCYIHSCHSPTRSTSIFPTPQERRLNASSGRYLTEGPAQRIILV